VPFQDATLIPLDVSPSTYSFGQHTMPRLDVMAAKAKDGTVWVAAVNLDPHDAAEFTLKLRGIAYMRGSGEVLTAPNVNSVNDFGAPSVVKPAPFNAKAIAGALSLHLAPRSVSVFRLLP